MNDTLKTIAKRYSCRSFTDKAISDADLQTIAEAGIQAPSARNVQGWHISLVKNKALIAEIDAEGMRVMAETAKPSYERMMSRGGKLFYNAQAVAFIAVNGAAAPNYEKYAPVDLGIVAQNISLAATSLGIDNCHCGMVAFCFAGEKAAEFNKKLKLPDGYECNYGVLLGYGSGQGTPHTPNTGKVMIIE